MKQTLGNEDFAAMFQLPPEKALAAWGKRAAKILPTTTQLKQAALGTANPSVRWRYQDVLWNAHSRGFFVARCAQADVLDAIHQGVDRALRNGETFETFQKRLTPLLKDKGWWSGDESNQKTLVRNPQTGQDEWTRLGTPRRLRTIYDTNLSVSYSAGHYQQLKEAEDLLPWWGYRAILDRRTRPTHAALDGHSWRSTDPIWGSIFPPNGWRCRCHIEPLTDPEVWADKFWKPQDQAESMTKSVQVGKDGPMVQLTGVKASNGHWVFPDPAWGYNPGADRVAMETFSWQKIRALPEKAQHTFIDSIAKDSTLLPERRKMWEAWIQGVTESAISRGETVGVGWINADILSAIKGKTPGEISPVLVATDNGIIHSRRNSKNPLQKVDLERLFDLPDAVTSGEFYWHDGKLIVTSKTYPSKKDSRKGKPVWTKFIFNTPTKEIPHFHLATAGEMDLSTTGQWEKLR